ncbi:MAG: DUF2207 domain-containing protein [Candidatus Krumholzibacteriia bacterium]
MKRATVITMLVLGLLLGTARSVPAQSNERIVDYAIEVDIQADGALAVTEHITVHAAGNQIRRGIYRDFPTRYRDRHGNAVVVDLDVLAVERDGRPEPWFTERLSNGVRINTGNDDLLPGVPADIRFTLRYRTSRQLGFFTDHDELYWNAIGTGWAFPIDAGRVEVRLPAPVPVDDLAVEGYTGVQGTRGQAYTAQVTAPGVARWELTEPLAPREGLTIVLSFPKGLIPEPSGARKAAWLLADNAGVLVALVGLLGLLAFCVQRWRQVGRDPSPGTIIARYTPPADRSPAELRYLRRMGQYDTRCFTGDLLSAAVAGRVAIEREDRMLVGDRWTLQRGDRPASGAELPPVTTLMEYVLPAGTASLELTKTQASHLQRAQSAHKKVLDQRLSGSHFKQNAGSTAIAVLMALGAGALAFAVSGGNGIPAIVVLGILMLVAVVVFGILVQAPTALGRRLLDEIEGLKLYLSVAERDVLAGLQGPDAPPPLDAARYEGLLPYAIALDVEEAWTRKFTAAVGVAAAAAATAAIGWYRGGGMHDMGSLAKAVGSSLDSSVASASTPPGSSSGSGGGGSSGGGGGGGGGGGR